MPTEPVCKFDEGCHRVAPCEPGCGTRNLLAEATSPVPPADRAAVYAEVADRLAADAEQGAKEGFTRIYRRSAAKQVREWANELRLLTDEAQQPEAHSCSNCDGVDPDTCWMNPNRPPEQCPDSEFDGYGLQCQKPAGHNLCTFEEEQRAADEPRAVTHARAVQEIRDAARHLYADAGIRVLAALDNAQE
jgi:hypothetical protein